MSLVAAIGLTAVALVAVGRARAHEITVYASPSCSCCMKWADHLHHSGFGVRIQQKTTEMADIKASHGITAELVSCHTALVQGYVIEGHVRAAGAL